jgi:hypothetical protein
MRETVRVVVACASAKKGAPGSYPRRYPPPRGATLTKTVCVSLRAMAALATTLIARLMVGGDRSSEPVLPLHASASAAAVRSSPPPPARDGIAGIRMPPSFTDHCLHYMETGRGAPLVAVTVRRG